ncbi:hypothetical protein ACH427_00980 [Streptomyces sp. NPDC020379]
MPYATDTPAAGLRITTTARAPVRSPGRRLLGAAGRRLFGKATA